MKRLILIAFPLVLVACRPWKYDAGPVVTENRDLDPFSSISVYGESDIIFTTDTTYSVRVEAPERWHSRILTTVSSGRLRIEANGWNEWRNESVRVYVAQTMFDDLYFNGSGDVSGSPLMMNHGLIKQYGSGDLNLTLNAFSAAISIMGSGDLNLTGAVPFLDLTGTGSGDINVQDVPSARVDVHLSGSGDARVFAADTLNATISGSGDVYYWGTPAIVNSTVTGSGQLIHMN